MVLTESFLLLWDEAAWRAPRRCCTFTPDEFNGDSFVFSLCSTWTYARLWSHVCSGAVVMRTEKQFEWLQCNINGNIKKHIADRATFLEVAVSEEVKPLTRDARGSWSLHDQPSVRKRRPLCSLALTVFGDLRCKTVNVLKQTVLSHM